MNLLRIKVFMIYIIVFFLCSCMVQDDEPIEETPYYEFTPEDYPFLLENYENNEQLIFRNQNNEELSFSLENFEQWKEAYTVGGGGFGPPSTPETLFYYDSRIIEYEFEQYDEPFANLKFHFNRFKDTLRGSIDFPLWNEDQFFLSPVPIDFSAPTFQMTINGITYNHVTEINSDITTAEYTIGSFSRNVNVFYYDLHKGLIGFDDLDGGEWRIFNID